MGQSADQLREEIDQKRQDAAQKIDAIETRVTETVEQARDTVTETVQMAKDTVEGIPTKVKDTMTETVQTAKEQFDLKRQVAERPLAAVGAAVAAGFLLGRMGGGGGGSSRGTGFSAYDGAAGGAAAGGMMGMVRDAAQRSGLDETLNRAATELMETVTERVRSTLGQSFPGLADKLAAAIPGGGSSGEGQSGTGTPGGGTAGTGSASGQGGQFYATGATSDSAGRTAPYFEGDAGATGGR